MVVSGIFHNRSLRVNVRTAPARSGEGAKAETPNHQATGRTGLGRPLIPGVGSTSPLTSLPDAGFSPR
jgi:hypothetical protein